MFKSPIIALILLSVLALVLAAPIPDGSDVENAAKEAFRRGIDKFGGSIRKSNLPDGAKVEMAMHNAFQRGIDKFGNHGAAVIPKHTKEGESEDVEDSVEASEEHVEGADEEVVSAEE